MLAMLALLSECVCVGFVSGKLESATGKRCWLMGEERSPCWWWKVSLVFYASTTEWWKYYVFLSEIFASWWTDSLLELIQTGSGKGQRAEIIAISSIACFLFLIILREFLSNKQHFFLFAGPSKLKFDLIFPNIFLFLDYNSTVYH